MIMKFTKLIMLASVVSLACARRDCARAGSGERNARFDANAIVLFDRRNGAANQRTGSYG